MDNKIIKAGVGGLVLSMFITGCSNDKQNLEPKIAPTTTKAVVKEKDTKQVVKKVVSVVIEKEPTNNIAIKQVHNNRVVLDSHSLASHRVTRTEKKRLNNAAKKLRQQKKVKVNDTEPEKMIVKRFKITKTYIVKSGDTISSIADGLKVSRKDLKLPRNNKNVIYPGDKISYTKVVKRFIKVRTHNNEGFCFKDSHSIHYRASERCK